MYIVVTSQRAQLKGIVSLWLRRSKLEEFQSHPTLINVDCRLLIRIVFLELETLALSWKKSANTSTGTVQFQYWASIDVRTGIGTAAMVFISSMGMCQVPIPILALPRCRSFPMWARAK